MALFKIFKGKKATLPSSKVEGYAYVTTDDGHFYVDIGDSKRIMINGNYFVVGSQTSTTGTWTGTLDGVNALYDGLEINYWLPQAGSGNATLTLTLADGTTTSAEPVYRQGTSRVTTHFPAGSSVHLTYRKGIKIGSTTYTGWWANAAYDSGNTYDRVKFNQPIKAVTAIVANNIVVGNASGYHNLKTGTAFDITYPILYAVSSIAASSTGTNNYQVIPFTVTTTQNITLTPYKMVYIKGTLNGTTFTPASTTPLTQTEPTSDDGNYYLKLGYAYASKAMYLLAEHQIYAYKKGKFGEIVTCAEEALGAITGLSASGKTVTYTKGDGSTGTITTQDTTYSQGSGISISGTTISNAGVRSISTGTANGTISVNTNGTSANVAVKGLGSAAYEEKGGTNGVASLVSGKVPSSQLPSYVDDVLEYTAKANFPTTGESGKIYIDATTNITYRWSGSAYVAIGSDLALGETSSTAFAGDRGKVAYDHATAKGSAFASGLYKITTNAEGHVTAATAVTGDDITSLDILQEADLSWGKKNLSNALSPVDVAASSLHSANRFAFANPSGITIEYSTDGGSTWSDYEASNADKIGLVSGLHKRFVVGKKSSFNVTTSDRLRITFNAAAMGVYTKLQKLLINFATGGVTGATIDIEKANRGSETTFTSWKTDIPIVGNSGWNSYYMNGIYFGGASTQTNNVGALRITLKFTVLGSSYNTARIEDIVAIGETYWEYPSNMAKTGHIYSWDASQNVTFPAYITGTWLRTTASNHATSAQSKMVVQDSAGWLYHRTLDELRGDIGAVKNDGTGATGSWGISITGNAATATKVSNSLSINGKTYDGSAAVTVGTLGVAYGGTGKTTAKAAANALIGGMNQETNDVGDETQLVFRYITPSDTGGPVYYRTASKLWDYIKGKCDSLYQSKDKTYNISKTFALTTSWADTGITGDNLETGSYIMSVTNNGQSTTGFYNETWTGTMSWFADVTNSTDYDEIVLHKAGHASNDNTIYLRTIRATNSGKLKLQIKGSVAKGSSTWTFKFRKLI